MHIQDSAEEWRAIPGYEDLYEASTLGRIRRLNRDPRTRPWKLLKPYPQWHGYLLVTLYRNNKSTGYSVHRLVALTFLGLCPVGYEVNHIDADKANNALANLEYTTRRENLEHADQLGLTRRGEQNGKAKLDDEKVRAIRASTDTQMVLAARYGVAQGIISAVKLRQTWKHVP